MSSEFIVSGSFVWTPNYDGCVSNVDISLPFVASIGEPPEPVSAAPTGLALTIAASIAKRRIEAFSNQTSSVSSS